MSMTTKNQCVFEMFIGSIILSTTSSPVNILNASLDIILMIVASSSARVLLSSVNHRLADHTRYFSSRDRIDINLSFAKAKFLFGTFPQILAPLKRSTNVSAPTFMSSASSVCCTAECSDSSQVNFFKKARVSSSFSNPRSDLKNKETFSFVTSFTFSSWLHCRQQTRRLRVWKQVELRVLRTCIDERTDLWWIWTLRLCYNFQNRWLISWTFHVNGIRYRVETFLLAMEL